MSEEFDEELNEEVNEKLIELTDEETGESILFEHLDTIEMNNKIYFVLTEYYEEEQQENDVYVMTVITLENGEETLEIVEDENEVGEVFAEFKSRYNDEFDFVD